MDSKEDSSDYSTSQEVSKKPGLSVCPIIPRRIAAQSKFGHFWVMKYLPAQFSLKPLDMHKCLFYGKSTGFLPGDCQKNFIGLGPFKHIENAFCITIEAKLLHKLWLGRDPRGMIVQTLELAYLTPLGMHYNQTHPPLNPCIWRALFHMFLSDICPALKKFNPT